jgi:hypothetical protein
VGAAGVPVGVGFNRERNRGEGRKKKRRQVAPACQRHIEKEKEAGRWAAAGGREMGRWADWAEW